MKCMPIRLALVAALMALAPLTADAADAGYTDRIIVKYRTAPANTAARTAQLRGMELPAARMGLAMRSQRITILSGGAWTSSTSHVFVFPGLTRDETNDVDGGTYTFDGPTGALVLRSDGTGTVLTGSVSGRRLTITNDADRFVYE